MLEQLLECPGYPLYCELLNQTIRIQQKELMESEDYGLDGAVALSQKKEYLSGLVHANKLVDIYMTTFEGERRDLMETLKGFDDEYSNETDYE